MKHICLSHLRPQLITWSTKVEDILQEAFLLLLLFLGAVPWCLSSSRTHVSDWQPSEHRCTVLQDAHVWREKSQVSSKWASLLPAATSELIIMNYYQLSQLKDKIFNCKYNVMISCRTSSFKVFTLYMFVHSWWPVENKRLLRQTVMCNLGKLQVDINLWTGNSCMLSLFTAVHSLAARWSVNIRAGPFHADVTSHAKYFSIFKIKLIS